MRADPAHGHGCFQTDHATLLIRGRPGHGNAGPRACARLHFDYHAHTTQRWADRDDQEARRYRAHYPSGASLSSC